MTTKGEIREAYHQAHQETDPRVSRFCDPVLYSEWAARADRWGGLV